MARHYWRSRVRNPQTPLGFLVASYDNICRLGWSRSVYISGTARWVQNAAVCGVPQCSYQWNAGTHSPPGRTLAATTHSPLGRIGTPPLVAFTGRWIFIVGRLSQDALVVISAQRPHRSAVRNSAVRKSAVRNSAVRSPHAARLTLGRKAASGSRRRCLRLST